MFTGLVEATGTIVRATRGGDVTVFRVSCPFADELKRGESVCVSGVCTTVTDCGPGYLTCSSLKKRCAFRAFR